MEFTRLTTAWRRWRAYRVTYRSLASLDQRELDDLGIAPWRIADLARSSVAEGR